MKLLHTSDWHPGKYLNNFSRHEEQQEVLQEICEIAEREKVNAVLIAGDLLNRSEKKTGLWESSPMWKKCSRKLTIISR